MVYLTTTQLSADRGGLLEFCDEVAKGILVQLQGASAADAAAAVLPADPAPVRCSPFSSPAAGGPAHQLQQSTLAAAEEANPVLPVVPVPMLEEPHLGLEAAASFNLDALLHSEHDVQHHTPNPALGPAL